MRNQRHNLPGFTLFELLIVLGILMIVAAATIPAYVNWQRVAALPSTTEEVAQQLRYAQTRAWSGEDDTDVGAYITSTTYTIYEGDSYATRDTVQDRTYSTPSTITLSGVTEVRFTKNTGLPSTTGTITLTYTPTGDTDQLVITDLGNILLQ